MVPKAQSPQIPFICVICVPKKNFKILGLYSEKNIIISDYIPYLLIHFWNIIKIVSVAIVTQCKFCSFIWQIISFLFCKTWLRGAWNIKMSSWQTTQGFPFLTTATKKRETTSFSSEKLQHIYLWTSTCYNLHKKFGIDIKKKCFFLIFCLE